MSPSYAQVAASHVESSHDSQSAQNGASSRPKKQANGTQSDSDSSSDVKHTHKYERSVQRHHDNLPSTGAAKKVALAAGENPWALLLPHNLVGVLFSVVYIAFQSLLALLFAPAKPQRKGALPYPRGRIAVIGGGISGVASAAHFIGHGFEVVIFDKHDKLGGIWSDVNTTSGLQLNSLLYRFFPSVRWSHSFPKRAEILSEIHRVAEDYGLYERTRFETEVKKVERDPQRSTDPNEGGHARWIINGNKDEIFDAIVVSVGTCGDPKMIELPKQDQFKGKIVHSSELDDVDLTDKRVVVQGAGASGVEAVELALSRKCKSITLLARSPHWVIPRNLAVGTLLAMQPFGREMPLSFIPERLLRAFHYKSAKSIAPVDKGLFTSTPVVNDKFLEAVRDKRVDYIIGDVKELVSDGVRYNKRENGTKPGSEGKEIKVQADVIVLATGFQRPSVDFLPKDLFPARGEGTEDTYERPNMYLQVFSVADWSVALINSAYVDAIGTVGHFHIGIYARILALFLVDKKTRPMPADSRMWVDMIRWIKRGAGKTLSFFTYAELTLWLVSFHVFNAARLSWMAFTLFGWGIRPQ